MTHVNQQTQQQESVQVDTHSSNKNRYRHFQPENDEPEPKKQRRNDQGPSSTPVNPDVPIETQRGQPSTTIVQEALGFSDIPTATHELVTILQFGTSYELVDWLAKRLAKVSERLAQEHRDRVMILKSLSRILELEEQVEVDRIGRNGMPKVGEKLSKCHLSMRH